MVLLLVLSICEPMSLNSRLYTLTTLIHEVTEKFTSDIKTYTLILNLYKTKKQEMKKGSISQYIRVMK